MTIEEQKLAVCEKLPDEARKKFGYKANGYTNWPTEGLQVCHEAEDLLTKEQRLEYLQRLEFNGNCQPDIFWRVACATYEQRLEALCRVWWPEGLYDSANPGRLQRWVRQSD